jgi:hypothetical protein
MQEIKAAIARKHNTVVATLNFVRQQDANDADTEWLSHWDAENRIRVTAHESVIAELKANRLLDTLAYKEQQEPEKAVPVDDKHPNGVRLAYTRYVLILPLRIELAI